jgi:hypothetical protein
VLFDAVVEMGGEGVTKSNQLNTNWGRGLIRLWLLFTALWVGVVFSLSTPHTQFSDYGNAKIELQRVEFAQENARVAESSALETSKPQIREERKQLAIAAAQARRLMASAQASLLHIISVALFPSAIVLAVGIGFRWVMFGFRPSQNS